MMLMGIQIVLWIILVVIIIIVVAVRTSITRKSMTTVIITTTVRIIQSNCRFERVNFVVRFRLRSSVNVY